MTFPSHLSQLTSRLIHPPKCWPYSYQDSCQGEVGNKKKASCQHSSPLWTPHLTLTSAAKRVMALCDSPALSLLAYFDQKINPFSPLAPRLLSHLTSVCSCPLISHSHGSLAHLTQWSRLMPRPRCSRLYLSLGLMESYSGVLLSGRSRFSILSPVDWATL